MLPCTPQLTQVAEDFGFNETQKDTLLGGVIMACFFAVGAPAAMVVRATQPRRAPTQPSRSICGALEPASPTAPATLAPPAESACAVA